MTGVQAKEQAELYVGAEIEEALIIINECLNIIGDAASHFDEEDIPIAAVTNGTWVELPSDTTSIIKVENDSGIPISEWESRGTRLRVLTGGVPDGDYSAIIRRMVPVLADLEEEIDIHPLFNTAIVLYLRSFAKLADDDSSPDGDKQLQMFNAELAKAHGTLEQIRRVK